MANLRTFIAPLVVMSTALLPSAHGEGHVVRLPNSPSVITPGSDGLSFEPTQEFRLPGRYRAQRLLKITEPENLSALIKEAAKSCLSEKEVVMLEKYLNKANMTEQDGKLVKDFIEFARRREGLLMEAWRRGLIDADQQDSIHEKLAKGNTMDVRTLEKTFGALMNLTLGSKDWGALKFEYDQSVGYHIY